MFWKKKNIKNVIFDLGGVLIDWNPRYVFNDVFSDPVQVEEFLANVCNNEWNAKLDAGLPFAKGIEERKFKFPQFAREIDIYNSRWEEMLKGPILPTVKVLEEVVALKKYRVLALSNWSAEKFVFAEIKFPFLKLFEEIVVSGRVKLKKPDRKIFLYLTKTFEIRPAETIFIDDALANIQTAKELGFHTIHFNTELDLKKELMSFGVKF